MRVAIGGKGKLRHITSEPEPPSNTDEAFAKWEENDLTVFSWILQNIEARFINSVAEYQTTKELWDALATTYGRGTDPIQIFELHNQASRLIQGDMSLEEYWTKLQGIWKTIDRMESNPMKCAIDIATYNKIKNNQQLFQFLGGLTDQYTSIKRDILKEAQFPTVEMAYATVRKEAIRLFILKPSSGTEEKGQGQLGIGSGLVARFGTPQGSLTDATDCRRDSRSHPKGDRRSEESKSGSSSREDKSNLVCSYCNMRKHTRENCFKLIGFPDWWKETNRTGQAKQRSVTVAVCSQEITLSGDGEGGFAMVTRGGGNELGCGAGESLGANEGAGNGGVSVANCTLTPPNNNPNKLQNDSSALIVRNKNPEKDPNWYVDCGATDTMSHDAKDVMGTVPTSRTHIATANGGLAPVVKAGNAEISPKLHLKCLYDIHTREIIGSGIERGGLYVVDEVVQ